MKRVSNILMFLWLVALAASGADFKLYYAKNVTDVTDFSSTKKIAAQLSWSEVKNGSIDGNAVDVKEVNDMLKETRMKGLEDQQLFWTMRDETMLAFRINDGNGKSGVYQVEVDYGVEDEDGNPYKLTLNTTSYFFAVMSRSVSGDNPITITVNKKGNTENKISMRYWLYDWDDEHTYIFQLDQKRQSTGNTYKMEYQTTWTEADGTVQVQNDTLDLKETKFQTFVLPENHTLKKVYFLTGNEGDGYKKTSLAIGNLHSGIDTDSKLDEPRLETKFNLTKHENREFVNFNWLGTGLFEKYDTLYIQLFKQDGSRVTDGQATINVHRVDSNGDFVSDYTVKYLGYDEETRSHTVLTYANPCYIEILVDGCIPTLYRYAGAADADTDVYDEELCTAKITLNDGSVDAGGIAVSDQTLRTMRDTHAAVTRGDTDYALMEEYDYNLSGRTTAEVINFFLNGGVDYPKLFENKDTEKYGYMEVTFSSNKGGTKPTCTMTAKNVETGEIYTVNEGPTEIVSADQFTRFSRDYYFANFDLTEGLPYNTDLELTLSTPSSTYNEFPRINSNYCVTEEVEEAAAEYGKECTTTPEGGSYTSGTFSGSGYGWSIPSSFSFSLGSKIMVITSSELDLSNQLFNFMLIISYNGSGGQGGSEAKKSASGAAAAYSMYGNMVDVNEDGSMQSVSAAGGMEMYDSWVANAANEIFNVTPTHIGWYWGGNITLRLQSRLPDFSNFQISKASCTIEGGFGWFWGPSKTGVISKINDAISWLPIELDLGALIDLNANLTLGIKSLDMGSTTSMNTDNMCFEAGLGASAKAGAWLGVRLKNNPIITLSADARLGAKAGIDMGLVVPFNGEHICTGVKLMALALVDFKIALRSSCFHWSWTKGYYWGGQWYFPDDNTNPYHPAFPYWLESGMGRSVANAYRHLRAPQLIDGMGTTLLSDLSTNADPHFLNMDRIVYNHIGDVANYNDDYVAVTNLDDTADTHVVSEQGNAASQHARSKRGPREIVVYQQEVNTVNSDEVTDDNALLTTIEQQKHTQLKADVRYDGTEWVHSVITPDDGFVDMEPKTTIQDDGKAAVIYKHGTMTLKDSEDADPNNVADYSLIGQLLLRTYTAGEGWSEPVTIMELTDNQAVNKYDLLMRNDTVLVGTTYYDTADSLRMVYASVPLATRTVSYTDGEISPTSFFMNRVGQHAAVAMAYQRGEESYDIFVQTLDMDGKGGPGADVGLAGSGHVPSGVKIITDRADNDTDDFAVLYTESDNVVLDPDKGSYSLDDMTSLLQAARVHLSETPNVTFPITVGAAPDSLSIGDYDGILDDDKVSVVYTLADYESGAAFIVKNEKHFTNSFTSDVTYSRNAVLSSGSLPVTVAIRNTGTSTIVGADVDINGQNIIIDDVYLLPLTESSYTVQYPLDENFTGYMETEVHVTYDNVFGTDEQTNSRGKRRSLRRSSEKHEAVQVACNNIDIRLVNRQVNADGTNTFLVELIDRSTYGLLPNTALLLGLHPTLNVMEAISGTSQTLVLNGDFKLVGNMRRAYVSLTAWGVSDLIDAYIYPIIIKTETATTENPEASLINNTSKRAAAYVQLLPTNEATRIDDLRHGRAEAKHRTPVSRYDGGISIEGIREGSTVRVFSIGGRLIYNNVKAAAGTHNVPLPAQGVYIISTGDEIFKYAY